MTAYDFFGTEIEHTDRETIDTIIMQPFDDACRILHEFTCERHEREINLDGIVRLLAEEVRSISFLVKHWLTLVPKQTHDRLAEELDPLLLTLGEFAQINEPCELPVPDAQALLRNISALDMYIQWQNAMGTMMAAFMAAAQYSEDDDIDPEES